MGHNFVNRAEQTRLLVMANFDGLFGQQVTRRFELDLLV